MNEIGALGGSPGTTETTPRIQHTLGNSLMIMEIMAVLIFNSISDSWLWLQDQEFMGRNLFSLFNGEAPPLIPYSCFSSLFKLYKGSPVLV